MSCSLEHWLSPQSCRDKKFSLLSPAVLTGVTLPLCNTDVTSYVSDRVVLITTWQIIVTWLPGNGEHRVGLWSTHQKGFASRTDLSPVYVSNKEQDRDMSHLRRYLTRKEIVTCHIYCMYLTWREIVTCHIYCRYLTGRERERCVSSIINPKPHRCQ